MKKLCILGSAPSKAQAPFDDMSFDIWATSGAVFSESLGPAKVPDTEENSWNCVHRVDAFFEMHKRDRWQGKQELLQTCNRPVYMLKKEKYIPTSVPYPADDVAEALGDQLSSSIAYMLALAIYQGYEVIKLYGVIMGHQSEYFAQRPGVMYYIGYARARGIDVWAPDETQLTRRKWRYGYDDHDAICADIAARKKKLDEYAQEKEKQIKELRAAMLQLQGAAMDCEEIMAVIRGGLI